MKFVIPKSNLSTALDRVQRIVPGRPFNPVMSNVLIESGPGNIKLTTFNEDSRLSVLADSKSAKNGSVCLPCSGLRDVIKGMDGDIEISVAKNIALIEGGKTKAGLHGLPASEFPEATIYGNPLGRFVGNGISDWINRVEVAVSGDHARYALMGVHFRGRKGEMLIEATDGRRVHRFISDCGDADGIEFILPRQSAKIVSSIFSDPQVIVCENTVTLEEQGIEFSTKIIDAVFPNVDLVIPGSSDRSLTVNRDAMIDALSRAAVIVDPKTSWSEIIADKLGITVLSERSQVGSIESLIDAPQKSEMRFRINPSLLSSALEAVNSDEVSLAQEDDVSPVVIRDGGFLAVVMPISPNIKASK